ncbi:hypothetical protein Tco_0033237 [Tanacetum coccineum]
MAGWKPKDLKTKSFANVQVLFDKAMKRVKTFVDMDTELVRDSEVRAEGSETKEESSSKRIGEELESDKSKKQKLDEKVEAEVDDAKEAKELKKCLEIVPDDGDDVTIDAAPLSVKIPIVDYKIYQEGKKSFFKIIRADGKTQIPIRRIHQGRYGVSVPALTKDHKRNEDQCVCMTRSFTNELFTPYKEPEREFRSSRRHLKTLSLDELRSPDFNLLSDEEYSEEEEEEEMAETMEQYISKT